MVRSFLPFHLQLTLGIYWNGQTFPGIGVFVRFHLASLCSSFHPFTTHSTFVSFVFIGLRKRTSESEVNARKQPMEQETETKSWDESGERGKGREQDSSDTVNPRFGLFLRSPHPAFCSLACRSFTSLGFVSLLF